MDTKAMFHIGYGLYVLTAKEGNFDNGCIINTVCQVTSTPNRISIAVNKQNKTCQMIENTGVFNVSVLTTQAPFSVYQQFGFQSGNEVDKFAEEKEVFRSENGIRYLKQNTNAYVSGKVEQRMDLGSHMLFIAEVTDCVALSEEESVTYAYYHKYVKPKPQPVAEEKKGYRCKICGYIYEGERLPEDFICPLCKHGAIDFEKIENDKTTN